MNLEHDFTVPAAVDDAWKVLLDVERVAPCMPGATLTSVDGDAFTGTVKVKVGPIQVTYKGEARFAERDETAHRAVIEASGKEARGSGTAAATVTAVLTAAGPTSTTVHVETDLNVTGRPAQFGRGVLAEVGGKLVGQFAACLAEELAGPSGAPPASAPSATTSTASGISAETTTPPAKKAAAAKKTAPAKKAPSAPRAEAAAEPDESYVAPGQVVPEDGARGGTDEALTPPRAARPPAEPINLLEVAGGSVAKRVAPVAIVLLLLLVVWRRRRR
jgi:carbon monoxide dehydrogenase subunit G